MSISPVGAGSAWNSAAMSAGSSAVTSGDFGAVLVAPHRFHPYDPANKYLTDGDRVALRNATGVDVCADGGITSPMAIDAATYFSALTAAGQIAADRAGGRLTGAITQDYLSKVLTAATPGQSTVLDASV